MDLDELELKIERMLEDIKAIYQELNSLPAEDESDLFDQVKGIENLINSFTKKGTTVPRSLQESKSELTLQLDAQEKVAELKELYRQGKEYFNFESKAPIKKIRDSSQKAHDRDTKNNYQPSQYTNKKITGARILSKEIRFNTWKDLILNTCKVMLELYPDEQDKLLSIKGKKNYFSKDGLELRMAQKLAHYNCYYETNWDSRRCVEVSERVLKAFGHRESDLEIHYEN